MNDTVIPRKDMARVTWAENMERNFPTVGAGLGFSPAEIGAVIADCRMMRFAIQNALAAKAHSKSANAYKRQILGKPKPTAVLSPPPEFTQIALPDVITPAGVLNRLQKAAARMKLSANYTAAIGELLRIVPSKGAPLSLTDAKVKARLTALTRSVVRVDWVKGKFHGVVVESQRGDETTWTRLGSDTLSPFIDTRPPLEAGKPEERRYRLRYLFNDEEIGVWSDVFTAITLP